jgi:hypothetical protein
MKFVEQDEKYEMKRYTIKRGVGMLQTIRSSVTGIKKRNPLNLLK